MGSRDSFASIPSLCCSLVDLSRVLQELDGQHSLICSTPSLRCSVFDLSRVLQELDGQDPVHKEFWEALMVIAEVELQEAVKQDELDWARLRGEPKPAKYAIKESGLHEAVDSDVQMMLAGTTPSSCISLGYTMNACCYCYILACMDAQSRVLLTSLASD